MSKYRKVLEACLVSNQITFSILGLKTDELLSTRYVESFSKFERTIGLRSTVRLFKSLHTESLRLAAGLDIRPSTEKWLRRDKVNYPTLLSPFKKFLTSHHIIKRRYAISILRSYEAIYLPPVPDLETVTSDSEGPKFYEDQLKPSFKRFLNNSRFNRELREDFLKEVEKAKENESRQSNLHYTSKNGVKGPTILTAGVQSLAISEELKVSLTRFNEILSRNSTKWREVLEFNQEYFKGESDIYKQGKEFSSTYLGRITFLPDKGGKTRLVAIGNYWIQDTFKQLHDILYRMLRKIPTDGTYDQARQSNIVREISKRGGVYSYDLSAATDRFPMVLQIDVIRSFNKELGSIWGEILTNMDFVYEDRTYRYKVGQPMGLYSSWAAFSISHHILIQYCASSVLGIKSPFRDYAILGDDVAIWNQDVAERYKYLITKLGVAINANKSFEPTDPSNTRLTKVAEFAKRTFVNGEEISGLSPDIQLESLGVRFNSKTLKRVRGNNNYYRLPEFFVYLRDHNFLQNDIPFSRLVTLCTLSDKQRKELIYLFYIRQTLEGALQNGGVTFDEPLPSDIKQLTLKGLIDLRIQRLGEQMNALTTSIEDIEARTGQALENRLKGPINDNHAIVQIILKRVNVDCWQAMDRLLNLPQNATIAKLSEIEYLPDLDIGTMVRGKTPRHKNRNLRSTYFRKLLSLARDRTDNY